MRQEYTGTIGNATLAWGARGRKFESCRPDQLLTCVEISGWVHLVLEVAFGEFRSDYQRRPLPAPPAVNSSNLALNSRVRYNVSHSEGEIAMATTTMVHVRVNEKIKAQATKALTAMGLSVSDAVRVFLTRVAADKQLPFDLKVPNAETRAAMAEVDETLSTRRARFATAEDLFDDLAKKRK